MNPPSQLVQAQRSLLWKRSAQPPKHKPVSVAQALEQALKTRPTRTLQHSSTLPPCPQCGAPAFDQPYLKATDLSHDCACCDAHRSAYDAALVRLWQREHALPNYLAQVPERYRAADHRQIPQTDGNRRALEVAKGALTGQFVYLYGDGGVGKTEIAVAIGMRAARAKMLARYWSAVSWAEAVRQAASGGGKPAMKHWDVLVLDDLDKFSPSMWTAQELYDVLEHRVSNPRCTVITANHDPVTVARRLYTFDGKTDVENASALASRLGSGYVIRVTGKDHRFRAADRPLLGDEARVPSAAD